MISPSTDENPVLRIAEWALSALGGALVMLVGLRTKLAMMGRDTKEAKAAAQAARETAEQLAKALEQRIDERVAVFEGRLGLIDRRTLEMMRLLADIARAVNVDQRYTDTVLRMLADEPPNGDRR